MKKIISRKTGSFLSKEEAQTLCSRLKVQTGSVYVAYTSVYGYPTAEMAERATLAATCEAHPGYTFAFTGTIYIPFEGYRVHVIGIKDLPVNFEQLYPEYVVIG